MPQPQKTIPDAAAPCKKCLRVVIHSPTCRSEPAFPVAGLLWRRPFLDLFAGHIAKPRARGQSFSQGLRLVIRKGDPIRHWRISDMRLLRSIVPALALLAGSGAVAQPAYPDRPIKMIVPLAAASAVDVAARIVTQKMSDNMGQQIVIINQAGAAGLIGAEQVARADPDGYTIGGFNDSIMTMVPNLQSNMRWDILKDFAPVSLVATVEWGLIASNKTSYKTAADLIAAAKAAPGKIDYGSGGPGSPQHLAMAMFASAAGISLTHVPYKGATQAATDVAAGQIPVGFQGLGTVAALVRGGQLRLIGVTTEKRMAQFPDVPTVSESGLPGFFFNSWFAIMAPAGTPKDIIARLNAEVHKAVGDPEVRRKLEDLGFAVRGSSPEELDTLTRQQLDKYARVIKEMGIAKE
jgi:tripartite-type tricarboxylate transporter receptor subunit TctC